MFDRFAELEPLRGRSLSSAATQSSAELTLNVRIPGIRPRRKNWLAPARQTSRWDYGTSLSLADPASFLCASVGNFQSRPMAERCSETEPHGVVGFRVILGALVAGRKGGDRSSIAG